MPAIFGSATIATQTSKGNLALAQDMIGTTAALRANSVQMQNGHIGAAQSQIVTPAARAVQIAAQDTPAIKFDGTALKWDTATGTWLAAP